uniref:Uncharacterized protein n=1 Tax=Rangifer tarandus platyrhynchus TaxID=3082113 RepID=A0ACB0F546_RANTA|nr:unnamed protein product [Rangifer tarandus platyrhynchus]
MTSALAWRVGVLWPSCRVTFVHSDSDLACDTPHAYLVIMKTRVTLPSSHKPRTWPSGARRPCGGTQRSAPPRGREAEAVAPPAVHVYFHRAGQPSSRPGGGPGAPEPGPVRPGRGPHAGRGPGGGEGAGAGFTRAPPATTSPRAAVQQCGPNPGPARPASARTRPPRRARGQPGGSRSPARPRGSETALAASAGESLRAAGAGPWSSAGCLREARQGNRGVAGRRSPQVLDRRPFPGPSRYGERTWAVRGESPAGSLEAGELLPTLVVRPAPLRAVVRLAPLRAVVWSAPPPCGGTARAPARSAPLVSPTAGRPRPRTRMRGASRAGALVGAGWGRVLLLVRVSCEI